MTHITRTKDDQFMAVQVGQNYEPLRPSELLPTKRLVWKNIYASVFDHGTKARMVVQDDTLRKPLLYDVAWNTTTKSMERTVKDMEPYPRYVAGKNPKR